MRWLFTILCVCVPVAAAAQSAPPPPPPPGGAAPVGPAEPKLHLEVGALAGSEQSGDLQGIDTSPGIHARLGYTVAPRFSILGGFRYIFVQVSDDSVEDPAYYDLSVGGRYTAPVSPTAKVFAELHLGYATVTFTDAGSGQSLDASGLQFGARAGGYFMVGPKIGLGGALSYTSATVELETMGFSVDIDTSWAGIDGFVAFLF